MGFNIHTSPLYKLFSHLSLVLQFITHWATYIVWVSFDLFFRLVVVDQGSHVGLVGLIGTAVDAEPPQHLGQPRRHGPLARAGPLLCPGHADPVVDHGVALVALTVVPEVGGSAVAETEKRPKVFLPVFTLLLTVPLT